MEKINKIPIFDWFYEQGDVYLTVITGKAQIPPKFCKSEIETFIVGATPTPRLSHSDEGINAPMRFANRYFNCFFPWESVIKMAGQSAIMQFITDFVVDEENLEVSDGKEKPSPSTKKDSTHLKIVK